MESRESKPSWADVPREVVAELSDLLGARIASGEIVWGGFGPSVTFLIHTDDDRKFFCKGSHPSMEGTTDTDMSLSVSTSERILGRS